MIPIRYSQEQFEKLAKERHWGKPVDYVEENASKYGNREALVDSRSRLTFNDVKERSARLAMRLLEMGMQRDDRVLVQLPNMVEWFVIHAALKKAGIIGLYTVLYLRHNEVEFACKETKAAGVFIIPEFGGFNFYNMFCELRPDLPDLKHIFAVGDHVPAGAVSVKEMLKKKVDTALPADHFDNVKFKPGEVDQLRMTSGTTGMPKILESALAARPENATLVERYKVTPDDIFAALAPLAGGASGNLCRDNAIAQSEGCKVVILERFDAEQAVKLIEREKVTFATGVPTMMVKILNLPNLDKYDLSSLRIFKTAGAYLPYRLAQDFEEKTGCFVINHLGGQDLGFVATTSVDDPPEIRRGSVGKVMPGVILRLMGEDGKEVSQGDVGEIVVNKQYFDRCYYRDLKATIERERDGLVHTGDLGKFDEEGNLHIVGRKKDMINRGGQNIYPAEVESLIISHPKVLDVSVVAMPDPVMGEKACAYVIPKQGQVFTFEEMTSFLLDKKVAKYKWPERLEMVDIFPMSGDGQKVLKRKLVEDITDKLKRESIR